jgi:hypothetical protein
VKWGVVALDLTSGLSREVGGCRVSGSCPCCANAHVFSNQAIKSNCCDTFTHAVPNAETEWFDDSCAGGEATQRDVAGRW